MDLAPPVRLVTRCTACGYERAGLALHPKAVQDAMSCERCKEPVEVLAHQRIGGVSCVNCY